MLVTGDGQEKDGLKSTKDPLRGPSAIKSVSVKDLIINSKPSARSQGRLCTGLRGSRGSEKY